MNTVFLLMAEYDTAQVELSKVCEKYLGMTPAKAARQAATQSLPFPVIRDTASQKRPYLVNIVDLAKYLDDLAEKARNDWRKMHGVDNANQRRMA